MPRPKNRLTAERLREVLVYDSLSGTFVWRIDRYQNIKAGRIAGNLNPVGYIGICIDYRLHLAHRLAWLYVYGIWPTNEIDHINGNRSDNRICNLREATAAQNRQNYKKANATNKTGYLGVRTKNNGRTFEANIQVKGRTKYIGAFSTADAAHAAYLTAKRSFHEFNTL